MVMNSFPMLRGGKEITPNNVQERILAFIRIINKHSAEAEAEAHERSSWALLSKQGITRQTTKAKLKAN